MKRFQKILVPTDLSENSRRGLVYGCWLSAEEKASLVILHVANEFSAWELYSEELILVDTHGKWPLDRVLAEASLDLNRFLEPSLPSLKQCPDATKRVVLGSVAEQIVATAEQDHADLVIMSPGRHRPLRQILFGSVTETVTRLSPCPVLSITPPLPSKSWRGKTASSLFGWARTRSADI